jgi:hypothetical protein
MDGNAGFQIHNRAVTKPLAAYLLGRSSPATTCETCSMVETGSSSTLPLISQARPKLFTIVRSGLRRSRPRNGFDLITSLNR